MKIREVSIKNCLSFCDKGLNKNNFIQLGDFNLFIGSNNAGKSNVLKLMELLKNILLSIYTSGNPSLDSIPLSREGGLSNFKDWIFAQDLNRKIDFSFSLEIEQADRVIQSYIHEEKNPVWFMFKLKEDWPKVIKVIGFIQYKGEHPYVTITKIEIPNDRDPYKTEPILFDRETRKILALKPDHPERREVWRITGPYPDENQWTNDYTPVGSATYNFLSQLYKQIFRDLLINIGAIREIEAVGDEIVESLSALRDGSPKDIELHNRVVNYIKTLVFVGESQEISFVYPPGEGGKHQIKIQIGKLQLPLSHYGSGVEQMLALAAEIVRHGSNKVVLIEEPEAHFHPELQRKFIRFLGENQQIFAHQYLIATHSNIFIDEFINMNGNVFYVYLDQNEEVDQKYSQVESLNPENLQTLFKDLGVKPSDLLFANGLLVVEGTTDKDVYTDWAKKIDKPFEKASIIVIDAGGAGDIKKYLLSDVIQNTSFQRYALYDKNSEDTVRKAVEGIVPDKNIVALKKGDIEDYYPRELVLEFVGEFAPKKGKTKDEIPNEIEVGKTVRTLNRLLKGDWWKKPLALRVIKEMKPEQIDDKVKDRLTQIYDAIY